MNDPLLYVGGDAQNIQRRRLNLVGRRCFQRGLWSEESLLAG